MKIGRKLILVMLSLNLAGAGIMAGTITGEINQPRRRARTRGPAEYETLNTNEEPGRKNPGIAASYPPVLSWPVRTGITEREMDTSKLIYTPSGHIFISPQDDPRKIIDAIIKTGYEKEECLALDFDPAFASGLMAEGFLLMSGPAQVEDSEITVLIPKHHALRSVLFFEDLHQSRSVKRFLPRYELRADADFDLVIEKCIAAYGDGWLTEPLINLIRDIRARRDLRVRPFSFGLYRNGELRAGEFGVVTGRVYTSYSGYHEESSAGTVQMILTAHWLKDHGFAFWDLGMPLDYKQKLGAKLLNTGEFIRLFRGAA
jgi:Leu/Phe-tRNA-protein transferase